MNLGLLYVILLSLCWGPSYLCIKIAIDEGMTPLTLTTFRVVGSMVILWMMMRLKGQRIQLNGTLLRHLLVMGCFNCGVPWVLFAFAEYHVSSALTSVINGIVPIMTAFTAHYFLEDEPLTPMKGVGVLLGFTGFFIMLAPTLADGRLEGDTWGILAIFIACCSYGGTMIYARKNLTGIPNLVAPAGQMMVATAYMIPAWLLLDVPLSEIQVTWASAGAALFMTLFGGGAAFFLYFRIVEISGATALSTVGYLLPIIGTFLGWAVKGEVLSPSAWTAFLLIFTGMVLINREASRLRELRSCRT